ncbi:two-component system, OmpR family, alkaline phosphatase synthesis response regulator PhoP [Propionispira arboris]|uniref:Two-component system, OmpR family, alkaline phosphatase synthesis response regulator PhoP n=1 Tax=Propionispira arboris TaxID=84035 RepID=A0A1H6WZD6_9FIRM|nr:MULTISPECIES: response regulator transcription factor [Propionispira]SEJ17695.1 two-component system, OmpR family, alkaline phosphatase synthesis response regulator PhoP [Propionispira arboris]
MQQTILVVDDDISIRELLLYNLKNAGYLVLTAADGVSALLAAEEKVDLILLDLMIPGLDGFEVCRKLKSQNKTARIPVIMLTAKSDEIDKVLGLELGADDYMTKPFGMRELIARVKAVLRRSNRDDLPNSELIVGPLRINFSSYEVFLNQELLALTPKEYELLKLFLTNIGKAYSRDELLEKIWGYEYYGDTRTVDVHIRHLRAKLAEVPKISDAIETVRGVGYRFAMKDK